MAAGIAVLPRRTEAPPRELSGWEYRGACADDPDAMFPPEGRSTAARRAWKNRAKAVCNGSYARAHRAPTCPVRRECLATALWRREERGIWGGMTVEERERFRPAGRLDAAGALAAADRMLGGR